VADIIDAELSPSSAVEVIVRNLCAVKGVFTGEYNGARGCFLIVMDVDKNVTDRILALIVTDQTDFKFKVTQEWRSLQDAIVAAKLQGKAAHQMSTEVQTYIEKVIRDDRAAEICTAIRNRSVDEIRRAMIDVISKAIAEAQVLMEISLEPVTEELPTESDVVADDVPEENVAASEHATVKDVVLKVSPILSPVHGMPARLLKPGQVLMVGVKEQTALKAHVVRFLSLKNTGADRGTIQGTVKEIEPIEDERVKITLDLSTNIIGTAKILGELKVKVSAQQRTWTGKVVEVSHDQSRGITTSTFAIGTILIFTIMAILAYLIFVGGII